MAEPTKITKVLVANRGEIALRIIKACRALGIQSVLALSEADRDSLPARMADKTVCIGPPRPRESYLQVATLVAAARGTGCDAIHPGYGFLAEQPELPDSCDKHSLKFIGPRGDTIRQMGNKLLARSMVQSFGVPVVPGSGEVADFDRALAVAGEIGVPVLIKAAAGGGGKGMKIVTEPGALKGALETARQEALAAFGDPTLYIEKYIPNARHIEVQVLGDQYGTAIHLGERDCSLQRRYQKIIEESPAYALSAEQREKVRSLGALIARKMKYESAGTIEFIWDQDSGQFYFMEMNTRIQVEHPVTEMVTGIDIVQEQLRIAGGQPLRFTQEQITFTGHAIECRVNAELAEKDFQPCPGRLTCWEAPERPGLRIDTHCYPGYFVPPYYDSLLAKVIASGKDRAGAIAGMRQALDGFAISGVNTTIPFLRFLMDQSDYVQGKVNTRWVEQVLPRFQANAVSPPLQKGD